MSSPRSSSPPAQHCPPAISRGRAGHLRSGPGPSSLSRPSGGFLKRTQRVPQVTGANDAQIYARVSLSAEPWEVGQ